jgi:voltage-gated potassium channel
MPDSGEGRAAVVATAAVEGLSRRRRRWLIARALLRAAATTVVMVVIYCLLPLEERSDAFLVFELTIGIAIFVITGVWQVRAIIRSDYPGIRAIQALAVATPLFLLLFSAAYCIMSLEDPETFTERLSRSDALYFTVTLFSTVGFGDITPQQEAARLLVTAQMLLDLVILGLGIQVIIGAVQRGRATSDGDGPRDRIAA